MKKCVFFVYTIYLLGCAGKAKHREEFVGTWKSEDNATISIETDGVVIVNNLDISKIFDKHFGSPKISMNGRWAFSRDRSNNDVVEVSIGKYNFDFLIAGDGLFENRPPWKLYTFIGDPDEMNRYVFNRK